MSEQGHEAIDLIKANLSDCEVIMNNFPGGGNHNHLGITVISDEFIEKSLLDQHQMIMDILRGPLGGSLHAIQLKTMTVEKYNKLK